MKTNDNQTTEIGSRNLPIKYDPAPENKLIDDFCLLKNQNKRNIINEWSNERVNKHHAYTFIYLMGWWDDFNEYLTRLNTPDSEGV